MLGIFDYKNNCDEQGNPSGGYVKGVGLRIDWQDSPLSGTVEATGAFVETVIDAAKRRIEFYNESRFSCEENTMAIMKLEAALLWLNKRTEDRKKRQVEGKYEV